MAKEGLKLKRLGSLKVFVAIEGHEDGIAAGSVLIARRNARAPNVYMNLYDALRSRLEIILRYGLRRESGGEMADLDEARARVGEARALLEGRAPGKRLQGQAVRSLADVVFYLERKVNPAKASAREKAQAGLVRSPSGRVNMGATHARLTAIDERLSLRQEEVSSILPYMVAMETALFLELKRSLEIVQRVSREIGCLLKAHNLFRTGESPLSQRTIIAGRLRQLRGHVETLIAEPFLGFRLEIRDKLVAAAEAAHMGNALLASAELRSVRLSAERQFLRRSAEALLAGVTDAAITGAPPSVITELNLAVSHLVNALRSAKAKHHDRYDRGDGKSVPSVDLRVCGGHILSREIDAAKDVVKEICAKL